MILESLEHLESLVAHNIEHGRPLPDTKHPIDFIRASKGFAFWSSNRDVVMGYVHVPRPGFKNTLSILTLRNAIGILGLTPLSSETKPAAAAVVASVPEFNPRDTFRG